ncbi:MAG: trimethylamine methyltransferase family protein [Thermoplasmata archaeon]|jgi:trimethylamine--corrinoid protein Co-methyltransferase|nr:trimethylamine methyltransferase family protein [Thermoplasmata archaeon]
MKVVEPTGGQLSILSKNELDRIHGATMEVLARLGVRVWSEKAVALLKDGGAEVDRRTSTVRMDEGLVKDVVGKAPREFPLYGRDPSYKLTMGRDKVHFSVMGQSVNIHALDGTVRPATLKDSETAARLGDALPHVHHVSVGTTPRDVPDEVHGLHVMLTNWKNSVKTTDGYNYGEKMALRTIEMAKMLRGGEEELRKKPTLLGFTNPVSPMQLSKELIDGAILYSRMNQPILYAPEALAGGTAPATLAGLLVQQNAEVLAGIMVSQLANPGAPVLYGTVSAALDMRTGAAALGGPEVGLLNVATAQLARHYGIPSRGTGGNTDSKTVDGQAMAESTMSMLMAGLAGMNFVYDAFGSIDGSITLSYEKMVLDDEVCGMVFRTMEGIKVDDGTLAVDEIIRAGPSASFLGTPMTMRSFRQEHFIPSMFDRRSRPAWEKTGSKDIGMVAREKARRLLAEHTPEPMDKATLKGIEAFLKKETRSVR